jgi:starch phosphorylase
MYNILENKIIPTYYEVDKAGIPVEWVKIMKNSIMSTGGKYSTSRMLVDYVKDLYIPLCNLTNKYYSKLESVTDYNRVKDEMYLNWEDIEIVQANNLDNIAIDAGNHIKVACSVKLPNINVENVEAQSYYGRIMDNGTIENIGIVSMDLVERDDEKREYQFEAKIELKTGGNYGYTFRVMPKHEMLLDSANLNLIKWITN